MAIRVLSFKDSYGIGELQVLICDSCGQRRTWDAWYTAAGVYPSGWHIDVTYDGRCYTITKHRCGLCVPTGITPINCLDTIVVLLWRAYHEPNRAHRPTDAP